MLLRLQDIPLLLIITIGVFLPIFLNLSQYSVRTRGLIALGCIFGFATIATYVNAWVYPKADGGQMFTRAFLIIGISIFVYHLTLRREEKEATYDHAPKLSDDESAHNDNC